jgi:phosphomannomutase
MADDFTFPSVRRACRAIAQRLGAHKRSPSVIVAYDRRFFSPEFALESARVLKLYGCRVFLSEEPIPTPAVAHAILHNGFDGGVNFTASHNPPEYNGLKFSGPEGGPAMPEVTKDIEKLAGTLLDPGPLGDDSSDSFEPVHPREAYFSQLKKLVRFDVLSKSSGNFVFDALHGCGAEWLDRILSEEGVRVTSIRTERDVLFDGRAPDPAGENLAELKKLVAEKHALAGLATDGDADRYGILDRDGQFFSPNQILALLFDYLLETRGKKLGAVRSVATSHLLDAVAKIYGVEVYETPVGFKYIGPYLRADKIVIGGEESAGLTIRGHVPEKDGILACLLVAEMIVQRQASLGEQLRDLFRRVGVELWPIRENLHLPEDVVDRLPEKLRQDPSEFAGRRVTRIDRTDGLKLVLDGGSWVLMRPSGTEPVVRIYAESSSIDASTKLAEDARKWISQ